MLQKSFATRFSLVILFVAAFPFAALARDPVGAPSGGGSSIQWPSTLSGYDHVQLTVMSPDGQAVVEAIPAGQALSFQVSEVALLVDGQYTYEMIVVPRVSASVAAQLKTARANNDDKAAKAIMRANGLDTTAIQSGTFTVINGSIVNPTLIEGTGATAAAASQPAQTTDSATTPRQPGKVAPNDVVTADDIIVQGSACIGLDCVNNESFGFDTIRLKENNTRIKFEDTSSSTGFPSSDWQLTANDSASGGANKFSIEDITSATVPFTITGAAPTNSLFVDSSGRLGLRTATPVLDIHAATSNTPAIRLEQNNAGGFTAQTWDIGANEANFFVRDVTGGSRLPFRIRPGAPTSSIDIAASGKVGIGTASPSEKLHVFENVDANTFIVVENSNTGASAAGLLRSKSDTATMNFQSHGSGRTISRFGQTLASWNEMLSFAGNGLVIGTLGNTPIIFGTNNVARMTISSTGSVTIPGNLTVTGVKNFAVVDPMNASQALYYTALEGPEAGTYFRGTAKTVNGEAVITLPGYFSSLTEKERMTVQLTPVGAWGQIFVAEKTPEKLVIRVAKGGEDLEFDFLVQGVRKGYLDYSVERPHAFPVK
jgi:hypothetical protein